MEKSSIVKNYRFLAIMLGAMIAGGLVGWFAPDFRTETKTFWNCVYKHDVLCSSTFGIRFDIQFSG